MALVTYQGTSINGHDAIQLNIVFCITATFSQRKEVLAALLERYRGTIALTRHNGGTAIVFQQDAFEVATAKQLRTTVKQYLRSKNV